MGRNGRRVHGLLGATAVVAAVLVPGGAAAEQPPEPDIIGGHDATQNYPFMVSMQVNGEPVCGGSLVRPDWVVTAGHCAAGGEPAQLSVRIGSTRHDAGGAVAGVARVVVHPDFVAGKQNGTDIGLLKLDRPVRQQPIRIAAGKGAPGTPTRILGWGVTCQRPGCGPPVVLQELDTKVVPDARCANFTPGREVCTDSDIPNAQGCFGDSGGPQIKGRPGGWELIGATSRDGDADAACATGPGIWTDVTAHRAWIDEQIAS